MRRYIRARVPGGTYFFTVNLSDRSRKLLVEHISALREAFRATRLDHPFRTDAIIVLPDHLHALWTLPADDVDYSIRWALIKARFSRSIRCGERISASRLRRCERGTWQRRYYEHLVRHETDFARHVDYIHWNPVKHGLIERAAGWSHSSFHSFARNGLPPRDWAAPAGIFNVDLD